MKGNKYTFYSDETQGITSIEQLTLYATFILNGEVKDHFIGLILISKLVRTHLSVVNIMSAMGSFFKDLKYSTEKR